MVVPDPDATRSPASVDPLRERVAAPSAASVRDETEHAARLRPRTPPSILLASASQRRASWLAAWLRPHGASLEVRPLVSKEPGSPSGEDVAEKVTAILDWKVRAASIEMALRAEADGDVGMPAFVVVADTLVEDPADPSRQLGQPADPMSAAAMLLCLSGGRHLVWSGTALLAPDASLGWRQARIASRRVESATVEVDDLDETAMRSLIADGAWRGKAGGYDLAGAMAGHARVVAGAEVCVLGFAAEAIDDLGELLADAA